MAVWLRHDTFSILVSRPARLAAARVVAGISFRPHPGCLSEWAPLPVYHSSAEKYPPRGLDCLVGSLPPSPGGIWRQSMPYASAAADFRAAKTASSAGVLTPLLGIKGFSASFLAIALMLVRGAVARPQADPSAVTTTEVPVTTTEVPVTTTEVPVTTTPTDTATTIFDSSSDSVTSPTDSVTSGTETSTSGTETSTSGTETSTSGTETSTSGTETSTSGTETSTSGTETSTSGTETPPLAPRLRRPVLKLPPLVRRLNV
ncbi:hypothetical protein EVG20_g1840, partial [Dentipellis fragilis]